MMTFEVNFTGDIETFKSDFQGKFEENFESKKYIIAGYKDMKETMATAEVKFDRFDEYWVYSLCHFRFSESIFNRGVLMLGLLLLVQCICTSIKVQIN
jgi:hypothetical protein